MSGLFQDFLTFSFSSVHYHAIGIWRNGLKCKSSQWWASTQPPAKLYLSHRQVCCHVASFQYYNLCFTSLWNLWSVYHSLLVMFVFVHIGRNLNYIHKIISEKILFFIVLIKIYKGLKILYYVFSNTVMKQKTILNSSILPSQLHKYNY